MLTVDFSKLELKPGMKVLDAGCGLGRHVGEVFRREGIDVCAVDLRWDDLCRTKGLLFHMAAQKGGRWAVLQSDVLALPFRDAAFDVVICSEVLEHIKEGRRAVEEIVRILKPGGELVVSVPRYLPERICWLLSRSYHEEPGGHVRIFRQRELQRLLEDAGTACTAVRYKHALHAPYWWLRCLVGHKNEGHPLVRLYREFLEWDIMTHPPLVRTLERLLDPLIAKSVVYYMKKGY
ncbi:MAG TPA: class I SAM-dependent methyltransferase [Syntrophales bacterium]|jgi:SAM-dependent methyltransferase|nr:class I SAM-dependent methyltransferase [Syntrophales bacterium]HON23184.1 class I SAM-dependent methyltransferase [Syntrophales bacterium]HOU76530.1 class I SAM-dependent methyltransferase [Syntrophales bacterium]HPC32447.1 class I SAM-dependent methyltransferase [Syntrophales bacterium]HQG33840.1 class I SAM-dependent methyltransferase [Syntrophales bacterium]